VPAVSGLHAWCTPPCTPERGAAVKTSRAAALVRHRRISLEHLRGEPWARIGERVGQRNLAVTANTYTHVLSDEAEIDYMRLG